MRFYLLDKLVCPRCEHFPLDVEVAEEKAATVPVNFRACALYCAHERVWIEKTERDQPCAKCVARQVCTGTLMCSNCRAQFPIRDRIPNLMEQTRSEWVEAEQKWWDQKYLRLGKGTNMARGVNNIRDGVAGQRYYERNKYLFAPLKRRGIRANFIVEIGAGAAQYVAALLPPRREEYLYVATDVASEGLRLGAELLPEGDFVQCAAANFPFRKESVDTLLSFGVLHHLPDWQSSLDRLIERLKPGGWILLNEAIDKPKLAGGFIKKSLGTAIDSPHGGEVKLEELVDRLQQNGRLIMSSMRTSPLMLLLVLLFGRFMERSLFLTRAVLWIDALFLKSVGRIIKTLGPTEVLAIFEKQV